MFMKLLLVHCFVNANSGCSVFAFNANFPESKICHFVNLIQGQKPRHQIMLNQWTLSRYQV